MAFENYKTITNEQKERMKLAKELAILAEQIIKDSERVVVRADRLAELARSLIADID